MHYTISDEDKVLFRDSQKQTRRLKSNDKVILHRPKKPSQQLAKPALMFSPTINYSTDIAKVNGTTPLSFQRTGVQPRTLRRLRQGKLLPVKTLDLHGLTVIEAENQLLVFLDHCIKQNIRIINIIHGKGHNSKQLLPPLKNLVNQFLRCHRSVLAFTSTPFDSSGAGAVHVLLKRNCLCLPIS